MAEFLTLRPEVQEFAQALEARLRKNDDKDGWQDMSVGDCLDRAKDEYLELKEELVASSPLKMNVPDLSKVRHEIEDTTNFLLFAWHNADQEFE